jgi:hypothetical protein
MLHVDCFMGGECNLMWIFFTSQSTLIIDPKIMLNLEIVCNTLNRIFSVLCKQRIKTTLMCEVEIHHSN